MSIASVNPTCIVSLCTQTLPMHTMISTHPLAHCLSRVDNNFDIVSLSSDYVVCRSPCVTRAVGIFKIPMNKRICISTVSLRHAQKRFMATSDILSIYCYIYWVYVSDLTSPQP